MLLPGLYIFSTMPGRLLATNHIIVNEEMEEEEQSKFPILEASVFTPRASLYIPNHKKDYDEMLKLQEDDDNY